MGRLQQVFKKRWARWIDKRIPASRSHQLGLSSIFIFPSTFGWGFLVMCLCLFLLGTNYQNNLMLFLSFLLLSLMLIHMFASYRNFARLSITALEVEPVYAGTPATLKVRIGHNHHRVNGLLSACWIDDDRTHTFDLNQQTDLSIARYTDRRGIVSLPRVTFRSDYPLGLFCCWTHLDFAQTLVIYPALLPCPTTILSHNTADGHATEQTGHDDFYSLREYRVGEALNRVAWKHVAKGGDWVSKSFSQQQSRATYLVLSTSEDLETALSHLAYQIDQLAKRNVSYGLKLHGHHIEPDNTSSHKAACLHYLAGYTGPVT